MTDQPIESTLPVDDEDFREIVDMFAERLKQQLVLFREALDSQDHTSLSDLALWLFGSLAQWPNGPMAHWPNGSLAPAGFPACTQPSQELEKASARRSAGGCEQHLAEIEERSPRVDAGLTVPH